MFGGGIGVRGRGDHAPTPQGGRVTDCDVGSISPICFHTGTVKLCKYYNFMNSCCFTLFSSLLNATPTQDTCSDRLKNDEVRQRFNKVSTVCKLHTVVCLISVLGNNIRAHPWGLDS
jgi:hypothetical protein